MLAEPAACSAALCTGVRRILLPPALSIAPWRLSRQGTWPTGIQAPLMDEGPFECLDFIYVWTAPGYSVK